MKSTKTIRLFIHSAIVLAVSYLIASFFMASTKSLSFFSVIDESGDVPMSDMYLYFNAKTSPERLDTSITFVDIDLCKDRLERARLIEQIDSLQPKVIGLDVFFRDQREPAGDPALENAIRNCKNLVIACILEGEQRDDSDKYKICKRYFFVNQENENFTEGFVNLDSDGNSPVETFTPQLFLQQEKSMDTLYCFAAQVARLYDKTAFQQLLQRAGNLEIIHFQRLRFEKIEKNEIEDKKEHITGKIVLIGSLSEDWHKTPINPQMCGMEIHAQIISTIIERKYIDRLDNIWTKSVNVLLCYLFALFCWFATSNLKRGVTILTKIVQVVILLLAFFAGYFLFDLYHIDIAYTRTIIVMGVLILIVDLYHVGVVWVDNRISKSNKINKNENNG